jgi:hypothetical protein
MADVIPAPTFEMQIEKLRACAAEHGTDAFRMRIHRRNEGIATFEGATVSHFVMPETWIPLLCGGGQFVLAAFHESNPNSIITTVVPGMIAGAPREVDVTAPTKPGWQGPAVLLFPKPAPPTNGAASFFDKPGGGGTSASPRDPSATTPSPGPSAEYVDTRLRMMEAQHAAERADLQRMLDANAKAVDRQVSAMTEMVKTIVTQPRASLVDQFAPLVAAITPIVGALITKSGEDKKASLAAAMRAEERAATAQAESTKLLLAMSERSAATATDSMKMMSPIVEAVTTMGRSMLQQAATMQELSTPASEPNPWMDLGRDFMKAAAEYFAAQAARAPGPVQRQLPTQAGPPAPAAPSAQGAPPPAQGEPPPAEGGEAAGPEQIAAMPPEELAGFLAQALGSKMDPAEIADGYVQAQVNKGFVEMVSAAGGPLKFFQARLGDAWVAANADYVRAVVAALMQLNVKVT